MQSKTSFFSWTIFRKNITRYWPLWAGYVALWLMVLPIQMMDWLKYVPADMKAAHAGNMVFSAVRGMEPLVISLMIGVLAAISAWGYLYNHKNASAFSSLPIRREGLFITNIASGIFMILVCHVIVFLATMAVEISHDILNMTLLLHWLGMVSMNCIFLFGFATLCAMLTGLTIVLPAVYLVLNFVAFVVTGIVNSALERLVFGYMGTIPEFVKYLTPVAMMSESYEPVFTSEGIIIGLTGWPVCIAYFIAGIVCMIAALFLYRKRRMESAGDVVAILPLRPVFRCCMGFGTALVVGNILYSWLDNGVATLDGGTIDAVKMCGFMIIGAFIGWFASDMMIKKTFKVFKKGWLGFAVISVIVTGLLFSAEFDVFGYEKMLPAASEVEMVDISQALSSNTELIEKSIELHKKIVEAKDSYQADLGDVANENIGGRYFYINYYLKNGKSMSRAYIIPVDYSKSDEGQSELMKTIKAFDSSPLVLGESLSAFNNAEEAQFDYTSIDYMTIDGYWVSRDFTSAEIYDLYKNCIAPDIQDGLLNVGDSFRDDPEKYACDIRVTIRENLAELRDRYQERSFMPSPESKRTNEWLKAHGVELIQYKDLPGYSEPASAGQISVEIG